MHSKRERHSEYLIPYVGVFVLIWGLLSTSTLTRPGELVAAIILQLFVAGVIWTWKRGSAGDARFILGTTALDVSIGLMRDASVVNPGVSILVLVPALLAAAALTLYVPEIYPAGTQYPASILRPATVDLVLGAMMGEVVLRLVRALSEGQERQRQMTEEAQRQLATEDALRRVATLVAAGAPAGEVFAEVSLQLARIAGASIGGVVRFDTDANVGNTVGVWSSDESLAFGRTVDLAGQSAAAVVSRTARPVTIDVYPVEEGVVGAEAAVAAPIFVSARLWGAASAVFKRGEPVPAGLQARFERFAELVAMAIANTEAVSELREHATIDSLTGIANRRAFDEELIRELERVKRHPGSLALVLLDIDRFKVVNDTYGHQAGDRVLAGVARVLMSQARTGDTVARLGGEEFVWLMPDTTAGQALIAAERARQEVAAVQFDGVGHITLSAGVNSNRRGGGSAALLRGADRALYMAKARGRDQTVAASAALSSADDRVNPAAA